MRWCSGWGQYPGVLDVQGDRLLHLGEGMIETKVIKDQVSVVVLAPRDEVASA